MRFQGYDATCQPDNDTIALLEDLTQMDYFLLGYFKTGDLKTTIQSDMLARVTND